MDSLVKLGSAMHELVILNILRENFFYNLSRGDILNIVFRSYLILALIFIDRCCLDNISDCKHQLSILKENNAKLKKLANTKKNIG
ncbi:MAG: hypothetical protein HFI87_06445 [Bacilli bacterium]|nr:hypothetical protein [Bacilli bacterium]